MEQSAQKEYSINIKKLFNRAIEKHRNGFFDEARDIYLDIIQTYPNHFDARHLLGVLAFQTGQIDIAIESISNAIKLSPNRADFYYNLANAQRDKGFKEEAFKNYRKAITLKADYLEPYLAIGSLLEVQNRPDEAIFYYRKALVIDPNSPTIWCLLGSIHIQKKELSEAIFSYQKAIQQSPDLSQAYNGLGVAFKEDNEHEKAIAVYKKAIKISPNYSQAYFNLGYSQSKIGRHLDAIESYKKALSIKSSWPEALNNLGAIYFKEGEFQNALFCYRAALRLNPKFDAALKSLGLTLLNQGKNDAAKACFKKLLKRRANFGFEVLSAMSLPVIYNSSKEIVACRQEYKRKLVCLSRKNETLNDPFEQIGITNFILGMHGLKEKTIREQIAQFYLKVCPGLAWESPHIDDLVPNYRIRIGFVSDFLHEHTIGRLYHGLIERLSKKTFHVTVFRLNYKIDAISERIDQSVDKVVYLPKKLKIAREIIADHKLDFLFYPEIGMDPFTYFLAFSRLAPVQCKRGFQITMGIPNIDYFISSKHAEPESAQEHYSEELILLEKTGYYYHRPELPSKIPTRKELGLPENKTLYACPQSLFKIHPEFDTVIGKILRKDTNGILMLLKGRHKHWETLLLNRFERTIPDVKDRIFFIPSMQRERFVSLFLIADAVLDTIYISGGNTSLECFAFGIPVVTWASSFLPGRLTYGFYKIMGIMDCVAKDLEDYVKIAIKLANDKEWYTHIKKRIEKQSQILFEDELAVNEMENFVKWAVNRVYENRNAN